MSRNMVNAGNTFFKIVHAFIVVMLVLTVLYAASLVFTTLYPNSSYKLGQFLKVHGLAQTTAANPSNPFDQPTGLTLGTGQNPSQTPPQTTGSNFGIGTGVNPNSGSIGAFNAAGSQPLTGNVGTGGSGVTYVPLAPIPGVDDKGSAMNNGAGGDVKTLIGNLFKFGIGLCSALAVIMIIYGGFMYVLNSGNESKISDAKDIIYNAIYGLVLALCIVIILKAVNASLLSGSLFGDITPQTDTIDQNAIRLMPGDQGYHLSATDANYGAIVNGNGQVFAGTTASTNTDNSSPIRSLVNQGTTFPNQDWNNYALQQIQQSGLSNLSPSDAQNIFGTSQPTDQDYLHLLASMASKESDFKPGDITAHDVNGIDSVGLLSMSNTDSWARKDGYSEQDLLDPYKNIQVGVQTLNTLVQSGGCISCLNSSGKPIGAGAYWSTVRPLNKGNGG